MAKKKIMVGDGGGDAALFKKKASFIQHSIPGLEAGVYELEVHQQLKESSDTVINTGQSPSVARRFGVMGPKYSLPASDVQSVYPPKSAAGGFSNSLAHVVLEKEKLPWIRTPYIPNLEPTKIEERHYVAKYGGKDHPITYDDDKPTWMAVLLVSPNDLGGVDPEVPITPKPGVYESFPGTIMKGQASDLVPKSLKMSDPVTKSTIPGTMPAGGYSIFSYTLEPQAKQPPPASIDPGVGHTPSEDCTYIDLPASLFNKIAPSLEDLEMMAHVRAVTMDAKSIPDHKTVNQEEKFGLVMGNRLPETMPATAIPPAPQSTPAIGKNIALLVSLENMQMALRGQPATSYYAKNIGSQADGFVRLVVLHHWSFVSWQDSSFEFEQILKGLNGRDATAENKVPLPNPLLRLPNPPAATGSDTELVVADMLGLGYAPMNHLTRVPYVDNSVTKPIETVSWYRGPFIPFAKKQTLDFISGNISDPQNQQPLIFSADQLLRFDPNIGMTDASYAAAWQLGQLVSLRDKSFSVPLYQWKKRVAHQFRVLLEDEVLQMDYAELIAFYQAILGAEKREDSERPLYKGILNVLANT